ncbi:MAG: hypothetical protein IJU23_03510 [Proteobacteria bacterium]|nr:hypothetical protein [Pseudomonadota bacterium]
MNALLESYRAINQAELQDIETGMIGNVPEHFYRGMFGMSALHGTPYVWHHFEKLSHRFRNQTLVVCALQREARSASIDRRATAWLNLAHYLRIVASNSVEAAHAYAMSAGASDYDALSAVIALKRLHRADPQSVVISRILADVRGACSIHVEDRKVLENKLADLQGGDPEPRAAVLAELALSALLEWGDSGLAIDYVEQAWALAHQPVLRKIAFSIVRALPDNAAIVRRVSQFMSVDQDFDEIECIVGFCEILPIEIPVEWIFLLAEYYAVRLKNDETAAFYLYFLASEYPQKWAETVSKQTWICRHAAENVVFRQALFNGLKLVGDDRLGAMVTGYIERFARDECVRVQALMTRMRLMRASGQDSLMLRLASSNIGKFVDTGCEWMLYDILSDSIKPDENVQNFSWNARVLHVSDNICRKSSATGLYRGFLKRFLDRLHERGRTSEEYANLCHCIESRLAMSFSGENPGDNLLALPENMPILASCLELIRQGEMVQALKAFFLWVKSGTVFASALEVLARIHAAISEKEYMAGPVRDFLSGNVVGRTPELIAMAILISPNDKTYQTMLDQLTDGIDIVAQILLFYLPWSLSGRPICSVLVQNCLPRLEKSVADQILHKNLASCMLFDALLKQVTSMAEQDSQQESLLDEMDAAVSEFSGDSTQKHKLHAQRFRYAETYGDERAMLNSLRDILEEAPSDPFATAELRKLDPEKMHPQAQILYYQLRIYIETAPQQRLKNQSALALLYTRSSQINNAITLYHTIIDEHPEYIEARYRLLDLLESLENWKSAENVLLALVNAEKVPENRYQCLVRLAILQNEHMKMPSRALLSFFAALDVDTRKLNALHSKLCEISESLHSFSALLDKYEDLATHSEDYEVRKTATILLANVYTDHIHNPALASNAIDVFYSHGGSDDREFLNVASEFYSNTHNWSGYVQVLGDFYRLSDDNKEKLTLALNIAHLASRQLGDVALALKYAELAVQMMPIKTEQWLDIANLFIACGSPEKSVGPLRFAVELETDNEKKCLIMLEAAGVLSKLDRLGEAAEYIHGTIKYAPTLAQLTPITEELIALSTVQHDRKVFNALCEDLVQCCSDKNDMTRLILQQALSLTAVFNCPEEARAVVDARKESFGELDLEQSMMLLQVYSQVGDYEGAVNLAGVIPERFSLNREQNIECLMCVLTCAVAENDFPLIQSTASQILDIDPNNAEAAFKLIQIDYMTGLWELAFKRIELLMPQHKKLSEEDDLMLHYYYGAILHASQRDEEAIRCLDAILSIKPDFRGAVDLKLTILLKKEKWRESLPVFNRLLELTDEIDVQGAIHKRIAEIHHFYMNNPEEALLEYEQALSLGGDVEDVPIRLLQLYRQLGHWQKAAMTAQILANAQVNSTDAKCDYLCVLGEIQYRHLNEITEAVNTYLEAFLLDPFRDECIHPLITLLIGKNDWDNINGIMNHLCTLLDKELDRTAEVMKWIADETWDYWACQDTIRKADECLKFYNSNVRLVRDTISTTIIPISDRSMSLSLDLDGGRLPRKKIESGMYDQHPNDAFMPLGSSERRNSINSVSDEFDMRRLSARTSNLFPLSSARMPSKGNAFRAVETLTFTVDDIRALQNDTSMLNLFAIDDLLDIASVEHEVHEHSLLPIDITDATYNSLMTLSKGTLPGGIVRVLTALASDDESPVITDHKKFASRELTGLSPKYNSIFLQLVGLLRIADVMICEKPVTADSSAFVAASVPPVILAETMRLSAMSERTWTARMAYSLVLTKPENLICASLAPNEIRLKLQEAAASVNRNIPSSIPLDLAEKYRSVLTRAGINAAMIPRISPETLAQIKQHILVIEKNAILTAFVLSQSLIDCLMILTEIENMRFPTTLSALKAAMKRSALIRELVVFALSPAAQRMYERVYK